MVDDRTPRRNFPLPHPLNKLKDDVERLRQSLSMGDTDIGGMLDAIALRSVIGHGHGISEITNLTTTLAGKSNTTHVHALDDLSDVSTSAAQSGQVLLFSGATWASANLQLGNISGLEDSLAAKASTTALNAAVAQAKNDILGGAGPALDTLIEFAAALGNDPNFAATTATQIGLRVLQTDYNAGMALKANLDGPTFSNKTIVSKAVVASTAGDAQIEVRNATPTPTDAMAAIYFNVSGISDRRFGLKKDGTIAIMAAAAGGAQTWGVDASGNMTASGNVAAYSDERIKTKVTRIEHALETLLRGQGVMYDKYGQRETGVIAQQFYTAIPELVNKPDNPQDMWSVKYMNSLGYVIEAFRDVVGMIEDLREEVRVLKGA